jgi:hypothetical protein
MPYLNKKIPVHNKGCRDPDVKRLYIRDYDKKGTQRYVAYAVSCLNCGALVKEKEIDFNPTKKQLIKIKKERKQQEQQKLKDTEMKIKPISQAELKEMKKLGTVGTCKICGKKAIKFFHSMDTLFDMPKEQLKKYGSPSSTSGSHVLIDDRCGECAYK